MEAQLHDDVAAGIGRVHTLGHGLEAVLTVEANGTARPCLLDGCPEQGLPLPFRVRMESAAPHDES